MFKIILNCFDVWFFHSLSQTLKIHFCLNSAQSLNLAFMWCVLCSFQMIWMKSKLILSLSISKLEKINDSMWLVNASLIFKSYFNCQYLDNLTLTSFEPHNELWNRHNNFRLISLQTNRNEMTKRTWKLEDVERIQVSGDVVYFIARSGTWIHLI